MLPFATLLLRSESAASSQIENLTASARAVALADLGDHKRRPNAQIIVANGKAMMAAIELADQIDASTVIEMHRILLEESQPGIVGHWRTEQNWIKGSDFGPHEALFVPPHPDRVPAAMEDLFRFIERDNIPVLAHAALAHAQFETIHPFLDGNGRTGRALIHAVFVNKQLVQNVTIPVSAGVLTDVDSYFAALTSFRHGDPNAIIAVLANATFAAISNATRLVVNLRYQRRTWADSITARADSAVWRTIDLVLRYPVIDAKLVETELGVTLKSALDAIDRLVVEGVLTQIGSAKRNRKWQALAVLNELDAFAERAGRRASA